MARPIAATPTLYGADAERIIEILNRPDKVDREALARRAKKLADARAMFKKVKSLSKRKRG
jgi:hypothetical protein